MKQCVFILSLNNKFEKNLFWFFHTYKFVLIFICFMDFRFILISVHDVTTKISSHGSNYIADVVILRLVTLALLWRSYNNLNFIKAWPKKSNFFEGSSWFKFNNLGLGLGVASQFYTSVAKGFRLKVRKFWKKM